MGFQTRGPLFLAQILKIRQFFFKDSLEIVRFGVVDKRGTLLDDSVHTGVIHEDTLSGFFLFKCQDFLEIPGQIVEKLQIVGDILGSAEGIFRQKDGSCACVPREGPRTSWSIQQESSSF